MNKTFSLLFISAIILSTGSFAAEINTTPIPNEIRAKQIQDLKFGMFICWSFSTFSEEEWTRGVEDVAFFNASGCDTDQWCEVAKDAGMNYILFLTKHHDGFCLWDTKTTGWKVTKSPLGIDVLANLRKSCEKYGLKIALYFSEGDWTWPDNKNAELQKKQLEELCTQYGPIEFFWMDHAQSDGGLDHIATAEWVLKFQPNCFIGFNHGQPAGRLCLREMGTPGRIGDAATSKYNKEGEKEYTGYLVAELTYPIQLPDGKQPLWFYHLSKDKNPTQPPEKIYKDYLGAVEYGNIFSLDVGPNHEGKLREIDVRTLREVGKMIRAGKEE